MLSQVCSVASSLSVGKGHQNHAAAFFEGHFFGVAIWMTCGWSQSTNSFFDKVYIVRTSGVRERCSNVMDCIHMRPVTGFLVDEQWVEKVFEQVGVRVDGDWMEREDDCFLLAWTLDCPF